MWRAGLAIAACVAGCAEIPVRASGDVAVSGRYYPRSPRYDGQIDGSGVTVRVEPQFSLQSDDEAHTLTLHPFIRMDPYDRARTKVDLRQFDYQYSSGGIQLGAGVGLLVHGVLESFRPVDVFNQVDLVEDPDQTQKLGQPYLRLGYRAGSWSVDAYALPIHRQRTYAGERGRIRSPLIVDSSQTLYESKLGRFHPSFGLRGQFILGDVDLGLTAFSGMNREPRFFAQLTDPQRVVPSYEFLQHGAADVQWTTGPIVVRLEAVARLWSLDYLPSFAVSGGLEYGVFDVFGSGADLVIVLEGHFDNRRAKEPLTFFDNDVFGGFHLNLNNEGDTLVQAGALVDVTTGFSFIRSEASHRLGTHWRIILESLLFFGPDSVVESSLRNDDQVLLSVAYFF